MEKNLNDIINCRIIKINKVCINGVFDFWQFETDKYSMGIYNPLTSGKTLETQVELNDENIESLLNRTIKKVFLAEGEFLILGLDSSTEIYLSLNEMILKDQKRQKYISLQAR